MPLPDETGINEKTHESTLILANAGVLTAKILARIAGNGISNAVNGSPLTRELIQNLTYRTIDKVVSARQGLAR